MKELRGPQQKTHRAEIFVYHHSVAQKDLLRIYFLRLIARGEMQKSFRGAWRNYAEINRVDNETRERTNANTLGERFARARDPLASIYRRGAGAMRQILSCPLRRNHWLSRL
jgi:hypothetical protein